jgi:signal transduction histidine kinase
MGTNIATALVAAMHDPLLVQQSVAHAWRDDVAVLALACAAALFVVAGVVRLARWRVAGDPHSALVGSALIVMGGLFLPVLGIAAFGGALEHRELGEALIRGLASLMVAALVLRAVRCTYVRDFERPARLLPVLGALILAAFGGLAAAQAAVVEPVPHGPQVAQVLSAAMALGWLALAVAVRRSDSDRGWSRRAALSFSVLALAEAAYGTQPGATLGTAVALTACTLVAALAVRSANLDLEGALHQTERTIGSLSQTLREVRGEAVEMSEWRAHLVHDADNAVAGLRAALHVLDSRQGANDPSTARLCRAAADEIQHLDHLLHRSADEPARSFDVAALVRRVALTASALGQDVHYRGDRAVAVGRPNDVVVTLKNLLVNADRHAPGSSVDLVVEHGAGEVRIVCHDRGPGVDPQTAGGIFERGVRGPASTGSGLGLHEARALMRSQDGDLVLDQRAPGACFVATLPAAPVTAPPWSPGIPAQRGSALDQEAADAGRSALR